MSIKEYIRSYLIVSGLRKKLVDERATNLLGQCLKHHIVNMECLGKNYSKVTFSNGMTYCFYDCGVNDDDWLCRGSFSVNGVVIYDYHDMIATVSPGVKENFYKKLANYIWIC